MGQVPRDTQSPLTRLKCSPPRSLGLRIFSVGGGGCSSLRWAKILMEFLGGIGLRTMGKSP